MKLIRLAVVAAMATCFLPFARGQGFIGPWNPGSALYVSDQLGDDVNFPGVHPLIPFRTVGRALQEAAKITSQTRLPVTINVASGTYTTESFPLQVPAFGVSIEARGATRPILDTLLQQTATTPDVILVSNLIDPAVNNPPSPLQPPSPAILPSDLPPSNINGLELLHGGNGLRIAVTQSNVVSAPVRMEVRDCDVHENAVGVKIDVTHHRNETVLEHNYIHDNFDYKTNTGTGVEILNMLVSTSLIRANRIFTNEINLQIVNSTGNAEDCRERVFSNFIDDGEWNVEMRDCAPRLTNNTIAFARPFTGGANPKGVQYRCFNAINGRLTLLNNIIWNPGPFIAPNTGVEDILRQGNFVTEIFNNDIEDPNDPAVGSNGNFSLQPPFLMALGIPERLHLSATATTPAIWGGANPAWIRSTASTPQPFVPFVPDLTMAVGGALVRTDIPVDVDLDSRFLQAPGEPAFTADLGADEISVCSAAPGPGIDPFGTVVLDLNNNWTGNVRVFGPPNAAVFPLMCLNYVGQPTDQNIIMAPLGNATLDFASMASLPFQVINPSGFVDIPINFGAFNFAFFEGDAYVQALVTDATGSWVTTRVRIETDF